MCLLVHQTEQQIGSNWKQGMCTVNWMMIASKCGVNVFWQTVITSASFPHVQRDKVNFWSRTDCWTDP